MRFAAIAFLTTAAVAMVLRAGEAVPPPAPPAPPALPPPQLGQEPPTEMELHRARLYAREGDMHAAVLTAFHVLREGPDEELREEARRRLREWGLTPQELLSLDPATIKPADLNALCERAAKQQAIGRRQELEMNYCEELAQAAVSIHRGADGRYVAQLSEPDMARALSGFIQVAFSTPATEQSEDAQRRLERMGCVGAKLEAARKAAAEGKLPGDLRNEVLAAACLRRLRHYQEWLEDEGDEGEGQMLKFVARQLGRALFQYCDQHLQATAAYRREHETVGFWRSAAQVPEKF